MILKIKELEFLIDDEDYNLVKDYKWFEHKTKWSTYARGYTGRRNQARLIYLHRLIISAPEGLEVDHIDGNTLNNHKSNLRIVTRKQNQANVSRKSHGVWFWEARNKYKAAIWQEDLGRVRHIGYYDTKEQAEMSYKKEHLEMYGENSFYARPQ